MKIDKYPRILLEEARTMEGVRTWPGSQASVFHELFPEGMVVTTATIESAMEGTLKIWEIFEGALREAEAPQECWDILNEVHSFRRKAQTESWDATDVASHGVRMRASLKRAQALKDYNQVLAQIAQEERQEQEAVNAEYSQKELAIRKQISEKLAKIADILDTHEVPA